MTKLMVRAHYFTQMEMFTQETGEMTKLMDLENTLMTMGLHTRVNGKMISSMEMVLKHGQMVPNTWVSIN